MTPPRQGEARHVGPGFPERLSWAIEQAHPPIVDLRALALNTGYAKSTIRDWVSGAHVPNPDSLDDTRFRDLCQVLGVRPKWLRWGPR